MHKRPTISNFLAINNGYFLAIRLSIYLESIFYKQKKKEHLRSPIDSLVKLKKDRFSLLLECYDGTGNLIFSKIYESNRYGNFFFKITRDQVVKHTTRLSLYEIEYSRGVEFYLGSYRPLQLYPPIKVLISDFDKTLADTRYSTTKEVYHSLTKPLEFFPTIHSSVQLIKDKINLGFHPFILTASPHFYEDAIRDWLYMHNLFTAGIFLKDLRQIFSYLPEELAPKDLKLQGFYKLNQLLNILLMTTVPAHLILMGDNFESDPTIYATIALVLRGHRETRQIWQEVSQREEFQFTAQQNGQILGKLYQLENLKLEHDCQVDIFIRKLHAQQQCHLDMQLFGAVRDCVHFYE